MSAALGASGHGFGAVPDVGAGAAFDAGALRRLLWTAVSAEVVMRDSNRWGVVVVLVACNGGAGDSGETGTGGATTGTNVPTSGELPTSGGTSGETSSGATTGGVPAVPFGACGGAIFDAESGELDVDEYIKQARLWDRETIDCRLGPKFEDLNPAYVDNRPTAWEPLHQPSNGGYLCPTYELSGMCDGGCDYGSTSGQVLYAPDEVNGTGVDRFQNYAYENGVICESIQQGGWLGGPHPDPGLTTWAEALGRPVLLPNGFSQTEYVETNAGIMIFPDGLLGATGNQTAGDTKPFFQFPPNKVPSAVAVSTYNEFAFVTVWDTDEIKGQLAVFALRADKPEAFSIPYFALPNEAGFSAIHLMGYVDLPDMATPTAIAVSGDNGNTPGGHVPGFEYGNQNDPEQNIMTSQAARDGLAREDYERRVPMAGQIVVASRWEDKIMLLDMRPLAQFVRGVYFGPDDERRQSAAAKDVWPFTFESSPEAAPVVVTTLAVEHPTVVRIGNQPGQGQPGDLRAPLKAWVGNLDGELRIFDISGFVHDAPRPVPPAGVSELAVVQAGRNLTSMTRSGRNQVLVASRGDRRIAWVGISEEENTTLAVLRTLEDSRFGDPVLVDPSDRGPVVTIVDFTGKYLYNYRVGRTEQNGGKPPADYGCGQDGLDLECAQFEFGGSLAVPGTPFFAGTTNVN